MTYEEAMEYYQKHYPEDMPLLDIVAEINKINEKELEKGLRHIVCDNILYVISRGFITYGNDYFEKDILVEEFRKNVEKLPDNNYYFRAVSYYFSNDYKKSMLYLKKAMNKVFSSKDAIVDEMTIIDWFFEPFKQGYEGFWNDICIEVSKYITIPGIVEYCKLLGRFYSCKTNEELVDELSGFIQKYPGFKSVQELLGNTYYAMNLWKNALACFENVETSMIFLEEDMHFMMAWSYGKCKDRQNEEKHYRLCLEACPDAVNAMNNLAYCLYLQKRYLEAKEILDKCLKNKRDLPYSANNYVRVLIALGRNVDAKNFIKDKQFKVSKMLRDKVEKLHNHNARLKKQDIIDIEEDEISETESRTKLTVKREQFSSEKILEDELTARIEAGIEVFGVKLKVYRRHGEYGRQYRIPIGRLDLLCEDDKGNLYIIELKKDSGYDDAYNQTAGYLDWFEKNIISEGKKVYGIICLNSPSQELIDKVHKDKRMKLFEYQVSYTEL
ncbi:MAG: DUF91 domain-containing protein [Lachnospiraceae bacterium]|nr:DUF91 domain-containing protein [Lachnospiraceae bacterium]